MLDSGEGRDGVCFEVIDIDDGVGGIFGVVSVVADLPQPYDAIVSLPFKGVFMTKKDLLNIVSEFPELLVKFMSLAKNTMENIHNARKDMVGGISHESQTYFNLFHKIANRSASSVSWA